MRLLLLSQTPGKIPDESRTGEKFKASNSPDNVSVLNGSRRNLVMIKKNGELQQAEEYNAIDPNMTIDTPR